MFKNHKYNGKGEYTQPNKIKYVGDFKDGKPHGNGALYRPDGTEAQKGKFADGKFQEK
jgi:hypothetical protein